MEHRSNKTSQEVEQSLKDKPQEPQEQNETKENDEQEEFVAFRSIN